MHTWAYRGNLGALRIDHHSLVAEFTLETSRSRVRRTSRLKLLSKDPILFDGGAGNLFSYVGNDPINEIDPNGLWAIQIGGALAALFPAFGGGAESGIAISYSAGAGLQIGGYQMASVRAGAGIYGGASLNITISPDAKRISDLQGISAGAGFDTVIGGLSVQGSDVCGRLAPGLTIGIGPGAFYAGYGSISYTNVSQPITIFGGSN